MLKCFEWLRKLWDKVGNARNADRSWTVTISGRFNWTGYKKMGRWKFFTDEETRGMTDDICLKLDKARAFFDAPLVLTCGYRDILHNAEIGGVPNSAHMKGMAADIKAPTDAAMREKLMWALGAAGFLRVETAPKHFHVDVDDLKPTPCFWQGEDR